MAHNVKFPIPKRARCQQLSLVKVLMVEFHALL